MSKRKLTIIIALATLLTAAIVMGVIRHVHANRTYTYEAEELKAICEAHYLRTNLVGHNLITDIHSSEFYNFTAKETTHQQILDAIGDPHATTGSGFVYDVYFTSDNYLAYVLYYHRDYTVMAVDLYNIQDGTRITITE